MQEFMVNIGIPLSQFLVVAAAILAIVFPIVQTLRSPKESARTIIGIAIFAVILLVLYMTASDEITGRFLASEYSYVTPGIMKLVSFSVVSGILFTAVTFLLWVGMEIVNAFK